MKNILIILLFPLVLGVSAQHRGGSNRAPVVTGVSNREIVQAVYPGAINVEKINNYWYAIVNEGGEVLGYAITSTGLSINSRGYNGPTPVMIVTDKRFVIQKVALMSHCETRSYIRMMENEGFFSAWNGKTLKQARKLKVDALSGATQTAVSVLKNVEEILDAGLEELPNTKTRGVK